MRKTLEDLYYGNITPNEQQMTPGSEMEKAVARVASCEKQLMEQLGETEQTILGPVHISPHVRIFEQISAGCEAKICRRTGVRQKFLTMQATKFAEKTCAWAYVNRP